MRYCTDCFSILRPHAELVWWIKCPTCGRTEFCIEEIHWSRREIALANPMARWDDHLKKEVGKITDNDPSTKK